MGGGITFATVGWQALGSSLKAQGRHLVCVQTTAEFLEYQRKIGNDLSTPAPMYGFPGLAPGDSWCVCASRWAEAVIGGVTAPLRAKASHAKALDFAPEETILRN